ncbi:MAG: Dna2/Cas4 domain-containing protein [Candidatus Woesearchaeota archaeon]
MHITGTLIKNFFHCKRQAYLYYYGLNFRTEIVKTGEVMHQEQKPAEYVFEKIKVDDIKDNLLIEYKKTSANLKGTRMQVLHYLDYFWSKGIKLKAIIKDLTYKTNYNVEFTKENKQELENAYRHIQSTLEGDMPPRLKAKKNCKGCSFFDYCWL